MDMTNDLQPESDRLNAGGGLTVAIDRWGDRGAPPVLFMHGAGQNRRAWDDTARAVCRAGWSAITVDHRGHGDSDWPVDADYDWDDFGDDASEIVAQIDRPPVLVGASLGGISGLLAQGRRTDQIFRAIVLVDVTPSLDVTGVHRILEFMGAHPQGFADLDEASAVIAEFTRRPKPESPDGLRQVLRQGDDGRWQWHWDIRFVEGRVNYMERTELLRNKLIAACGHVAVPCLVMRGTRSDLVTPEAVKEFVDLVPGSTYVDVTDAGHMIAGDQNDRFTTAVLDFLRTLR